MADKSHKGRGGARHRLAYNNDRGFFYYLEPSMGVDAIVNEFVGRLRGTRIDTLVARIDWGNLTPLFDSKIEGKFGARYKRFPQTRNWRGVTMMRRLLDADVDPYALVFEAAREAGMAAFTGIRMNDLHHTKAKATFRDFFASDIVLDPKNFIGDDVEHFALQWDPEQGGPPRAPNFLRDEIREHRYRAIEEICTRYDVDGFEMDFQRHGVFFPHSEAQRGMPMMTDLVRRVRGMLDKQEARRGHPISLMVRVPTTVEVQRETGLDVVAWIKEGLVDVVALSSLCFSEFDSPVEEIVKVAAPTPVEVFATFEYIIHPPYKRYIPELARAGAAWYHRQGVDGIYFENCHMFYKPILDESDWTPRLRQPSEHFALYSEVHDPRVLRFRNKRYIVSHAVPNEAHATYEKQLPFSLARDETDTPRQFILRVADDPSEGDRRGLLEGVELWLRVTGLCEEDGLAVSLNGHDLAWDSRRAGTGAANDAHNPYHLLKWTLTPGWIVEGENVVAIGLARAIENIDEPIVIDGIEMPIDYRALPTAG